MAVAVMKRIQSLATHSMTSTLHAEHSIWKVQTDKHKKKKEKKKKTSGVANTILSIIKKKRRKKKGFGLMAQKMLCGVTIKIKK